MRPDYDVLIVGAGVSGIGAAVHMTQKCPGKRLGIIEARERIGGTWDLFRYPGIRSDSDMHTFGFKFKPWTNPKAIADAPSILKYLNETVDEYGFRDRIRFNHKMIRASWSTPDAMWTVTVETPEGETQITANFLMGCSGYYSYDNPHNPDIPGQENFDGPIIHPQHWDESLDYRNKKVVVIGSGATAVTIIPSMADDTSHITMLQRTPTYIVTRPAKDWFANLMRKIMPEKWAYAISREKNVLLQNYIYKSALKNPQKVKDGIDKMTRKSLGLRKNAELSEDYRPPYNPWQQRLCVVPDNDMFEAIKSGKASIVTDHIDQIEASGIRLKSGQFLGCDIIIKATGISVILMANGEFTVDGQVVDFSKTYTYEGMMFSDVPNMVSIFGYINASWTLRADLIAEYACRLVNHMDQAGMRQATPRAPDGMEGRPWITTFDPGYITRILPSLPMQGDRDPWRNTQDFKRDRKVLPSKPIDDGHMEFSNPVLEARDAAE